MCIIDRYLLRQFTQTFIICFLSLMGLYVVIEASTNLDAFIRDGQKAGGVVALIAEYYAYRSLWLFDVASGVLALVAAMFTISWIQRHNEMTALMAAGVSRLRVVVPVIAAVGVVSLLSAANRELLIPRYRSELSRPPQDPLGGQRRSFTARYDDRTNVLLGGKRAIAEQKCIEEPSFALPPALSDHGSQLIAEKAFYLPPDGRRPGGYLLAGVREPRNLDTSRSLPVGDHPILITPQDAPDWLNRDQCFLQSDVDFDQLTNSESFLKLASTPQLIAALRNPSLGYGLDVRVAIHARIIKPLTDMTLLLLGLPLIVSRENRNVFIAIGICMGVTMAFTLTSIGMQQLGEIGYLLNPALSVWAPLILFIPPAVGMAESLRR